MKTGFYSLGLAPIRREGASVSYDDRTGLYSVSHPVRLYLEPSWVAWYKKARRRAQRRVKEAASGD